MTELDELARIQQAHHRRLLGLQGAARQLVGEAWDTFAGLDVGAAAGFTAAAGVVLEQVEQQTATVAVAYMNANDRLGGFPDAGLIPEVPTIRNGIPTGDVYQRSIVEARRRIAGGATFDEAMAAGRARAVSTASTDVSLVNRATIDAAGDLRPWVVGYRRVLTGKSCAFCAVASTQRYKRAILLPLHPYCDCDVAEILGTEDPGRVINRELLSALKSEGVVDDISAARALPKARVAAANAEARVGRLRAELAAEGDPARRRRLTERLGRAEGQQVKASARVESLRGTRGAGPRNYMVDEDGAIRFRKFEDVTDDAGAPVLRADGRPRQRVTPGDRVRPEVVDHGELGPTLTNAKHETTKPRDLTPGVPEVKARRTKATEQDPDVLAEASRRNVSPTRVIELREAKAERRFLEDRARREAAKALTVDSPDVIRVAARFGVSGDEVLTARHRVADVRAVAREAAARTQAEALRELDRFQVLRLKNPPRTGAKSGGGTALRQGEWDWLEQISDREKARLSRQWYGGTQGPDQLAAAMSEGLGRDVSVQEAVERWLAANRRAEAAGALRRGKLPSADAYSGEIDADDLIRDLADEGYDAAIVFGDDLEAAAHIAAVERELIQADALGYLGDAARAELGPAPYRMSFQTWEEEVRTLEFAATEGTASAPELARLEELVPRLIDGPGVDYEELYARIVSTARKAGEEVPEHAVIPWA